MPPSNQYHNNYLTDVIAKINFPILLDLVNNSPKDFQDKIISNFPILEPIKQFGVKIENKGDNFTAEKENRTVWRFKSKDGNKIVELDFESMAFVLKKYSNYTDFRSEFSTLFDSLMSAYPNILINRFGLRYINLVNLNETNFFEWASYINSDMVKNLDFIEDKSQIRRAMGAFELKCDEDSLLNVKYGMINTSYPNPIIKKEFILDFDCYTQVQFEKENMLSNMDKYHTYIKTYFEKSITESLRTKLRHE